MQQNEWIYDWNVAATPLIAPGTRVLLNDETLRDGLQNPSVHDPSIEEKIEILHLMEALGIDSLNIDDVQDLRRPVHSILLKNEIPIVEHMTNLAALPHADFRFFAVPVKVKGFGTFPVRAFAIV